MSMKILSLISLFNLGILLIALINPALRSQWLSIISFGVCALLLVPL